MLPYWLLFFFFAVGALSTMGHPLELVPTSGRSQATLAPRVKGGPVLVFGTLIVIVMVGLRYKVGADWDTYELMYYATGARSLLSAMKIGDPAYEMVNWVAFQLGVRIWAVNMVCAFIFGWGLFRFCQAQSYPWLAAAVAIPYMVIVVAMAYTRQGVALGILLAGLARQIRGASIVNFALYTLAAAAFHATAVILFPIVALSKKGNPVGNILIAVFSSYFLFDVFIGNLMDKFVSEYIRTGYTSQGAFIRVVMNAVAALFLVFFRKRLQFPDEQWRLWRNVAIAAFSFVIILPLAPSSTVIDRISLYLMPLQLAVFSQLGTMARNKAAWVGAILLYMGAVQGVWLVFAKHSEYWVPYRLYPFGDASVS